MDKIEINGGNRLFGTAEVSLAKNAYLPILAGAILCDGEVILKRIPNFEDIKIMCEILQHIGINKQIVGKDLYLDCKSANGWEIPEEQTKLIRSSIFSLGSVLGRFKKAKVAYPGGCAIGSRPIDLHIKGLKALNVKIEETCDGFLICDGSEMKAADIFLDFPSVGATENIMMAACKTKGTSRIINSAKEPEIVDLQNFLNAMGAKISGAGTNIITIIGVDKLSSVEYKPISDRIITGTLIIGCAVAGGKIEILSENAPHLKSLIKKINKYCCNITCYNDKIIVESQGTPKAFKNIKTEPYPGFPTDLQPQIVALGCVCEGNTSVEENLFETRFKHIPELVKMGAKIDVVNKTAIINGSKLHGANVESADLRGGACLVLAGLAAEGKTVVSGVNHIDRGYENIENIFANLGADIKRLGD